MRHLLAACAVLLLLASTATGAEIVRAGAAVRDITPPPGMPLGGYGERFGKSHEGVHDRLEAQAVVIEGEGGRRVAVVSLDTVGVDEEMRAAVLARLPVELGIGDGNLLLTATHNHSGPGALAKRLVWLPAMGRFNEKLFSWTADRIVTAVAAAAADLRPAKLEFGRTSVRGLVRNRRNPGGAVDESLAVLSIRAPSGATRALVVFLAIHPTVLSGKNLLVSADFPGALRATLREGQDEELPVLVLQGPLGDQAPSAPSVTDPFERMEAFGRALAAKVEEALSSAKPLGVRMASEVERAPLPPSMLGDLVADRALVQRISIGGLTLLAIPGEMTAAPGIRLRSRVERDTRRPTVLVGCANDHLGYFAGETEWREAGYESLMSFYGPDAANVLARAFGAADAPVPPGPGGGELEDRAGIRFVKLWGSPRERGRAHGRLLRGAIRAMLAEVEVEVRRMVLKEDLPVEVRGILALYPQAKRLLFPLMAARARSLHRFVPEDLVEEMKGVAEGAGLPYDAVFLMNTFLTLSEQTDRDVLLKLPAHCTNAVLFGGASRDGRLLLARNLDWGMTEILPKYATVTLYEPARGHAFLSVGWAGMTGTLTALNRAGISITEESVKDPTDTDLDGVPIMLLLRDAIQRSGTLDEAVRRVRDASGTCGYHVTIASGRERDARVVEVTGTKASVRGPEDGVLLGCSGEPNRRYRWLRERLGERAGPLGPKELLALFRSGDGGLANDGTLHSVLMVPKSGTMLVAQGRVPATAGTYRLFDLDREATGRPSAPPTPPVTIEPLTATHRSGRVQLVWFQSESPSGAPENDRFAVEHYVPEGVAKGAIAVLPIWKGRHAIAERIVAGHLASKGYQAAIVPLAWQFRRSPRGVRSGDWTVSSDLDRTKAALEQSAADVRTVLTWLRARDDVEAGRVGVLGISLGAHVAAVSYRRDPRIRAGVFVMAGADPAGIVWNGSRETRRMKGELLARGVTLATLREYFAPMDPAAPLDAPELPGFSRHRGILMVNGTKDKVIPPENGRALHESLGRPDIVWLEANHYSMALRIHEVLAQTDRHLNLIFR